MFSNFQYGTLIPGHTSITTAMTNQLDQTCGNLQKILMNGLCISWRETIPKLPLRTKALNTSISRMQDEN